MAGIGSGSFTVLRYTKESGEEEVGYNAGDDLREVPITGNSFKYSKSMIESKNINPSRQIKKLIKSNSSVSGDINIEFAPKVYDDFIAAALWSSWQETARDALYDVALTAPSAGVHGGIITDTLGGQTISWQLVPGQWIRLSPDGGTPISGANDGIYLIKELTDDTIVLSESTPIQTAESGKTARFKASMARVPMTGNEEDIDRTRFFLERQHIDLVPSQFFAFDGCLVDGLTMNGSSGAIISGRISMIGDYVSVYNNAAYDETDNPRGNGAGSIATLNGDTLLDALAFSELNTVSHVKGILVNGTDINRATGGDLYVQDLSFALKNNLKGSKAIGYTVDVEKKIGKLNVTGVMSVYFSSDEIQKKYQNGEEFSLSYWLENEAGDGYLITFPRVKLTKSSVNLKGNNKDLIEQANWIAMYDDTTQTSMQIDRFYASYDSDVDGSVLDIVFDGQQVVFNADALVYGRIS